MRTRKLLPYLLLFTTLPSLAQIRADSDVYFRKLKQLGSQVDQVSREIESTGLNTQLLNKRGYAYLNLAHYSTKRSMYSRAKRDFRKVLKLDQDNADSRMGMGLVKCRDLAGKGKLRHRRALKEFETVLKADEANLDALCYMAFAHMKFDHKDKYFHANKYLDLADDLYPQNPKVNYFKGLLAYLQQNYRIAITTWNEVDEYASSLFPKIGLIGHSHYMLGEMDQAFNAFQRSSWKFESPYMLKFWELAVQIQ